MYTSEGSGSKPQRKSLTQPPAALGKFESQATPASPPVADEASEGAMRTHLRRFAEQFDAQVRPLGEPLDATAAALEAAGPRCRAKSVLGQLREVQHQLTALVDKVAQQQAYVLIFGPLKSGKSTFMNALCASYVSEVTALPAYPCLVHVSAADSASYTLRRYDGSSQSVSDRNAMARQVEQAHRQLTQRIRQVEAEGGQFEPADHMPDAIRRIDVKLPVEELSRGGAVLVDTPGLYSRMKFGYDRMTRDFRNTAACAIFIVKTDNLFLEQVFEEFGQLLELFSRVFLIVNLDHNKQDLQPDGSLAPSLERQDPAQVVEAFRTLSMSGPLKSAADEGRLRIYPVDLLRAASARIRGEKPDAAGDFGPLLDDLTDYLNSSEYLREFMTDSLRRLRGLLGELGQWTQHESVRDLFDQLRMLRKERQQTQDRLASLQRLQKVNWARQSNPLRQRVAEALEARAADLHETSGLALAGAVDGWFESEQSLAEFNTRHLQGLLRQCQQEMLEAARKALNDAAAAAPIGFEVDADVRADLDRTQIDLADVSAEARGQAVEAARLQPVEARIAADDLPVQKTWVDWLLLRSRPRVRSRLFGPEGAERTIPAAEKQRRLGEPARQVMRETCLGRLEQTLAAARQELTDGWLGGYVSRVAKAADARIAESAEAAQAQLGDTEALIAQSQQVTEQVERLRKAIDDTTAAATAIQPAPASEAGAARAE